MFQTLSTSLNEIFYNKNILHIIYDKFQDEQMHKPATVSTHISILILQQPWFSIPLQSVLLSPISILLECNTRVYSLVTKTSLTLGLNSV